MARDLARQLNTAIRRDLCSLVAQSGGRFTFRRAEWHAYSLCCLEEMAAEGILVLVASSDESCTYRLAGAADASSGQIDDQKACGEGPIDLLGRHRAQ